MTKTKADRIMRGWFGTKGEESSQEVVADKSYSIAGRKGDIGIRNQQDQAIMAEDIVPTTPKRTNCQNLSRQSGCFSSIALLILIIVQHFFHIIERTTFYLFINLANIQSDSSYG